MDSLRVLMVEDSATLAALAIRGLRQAGIQNADYALNGEQALAYIKAQKPDLLLLDLRLPDMDGWDVLEQAQAMYPGETLHVIVMTTYDTKETRQRAKSLGVAQYVIKPVMPNELVQIIEEQIALNTG